MVNVCRSLEYIWQCDHKCTAWLMCTGYWGKLHMWSPVHNVVQCVHVSGVNYLDPFHIAIITYSHSLRGPAYTTPYYPAASHRSQLHSMVWCVQVPAVRCTMWSQVPGVNSSCITAAQCSVMWAGPQSTLLCVITGRWYGVMCAGIWSKPLSRITAAQYSVMWAGPQSKLLCYYR